MFPAFFSWHRANRRGAVCAAVLFAAFGMLPTISHAAPVRPFQDTAKPATQTALLTNEDFAAGLRGWQLSQSLAASVSVVAHDSATPTPKPTRGSVLRLPIAPQPGGNPWDVTLRQTLAKAVRKGDTVTVKLWLRSENGAKLLAAVEEAKAPYAKSVEQVIEPTPQWREYTLTGTAKNDYVAGGGASFVMLLGYKAATVEVADVRVTTGDSGAVTAANAPVATANSPVALVQNGDFAEPLGTTWIAGGTAPPRLSARPVTDAVSGLVAKQTLQIAVTPSSEPKLWYTQVRQTIAPAIKKGDTVSIRAWMRSPKRQRVVIKCELRGEPFTPIAQKKFQPAPQWQEYRFTGVAPQDFAAGTTQFNILNGETEGTLEITDIRVENHGATPRDAVLKAIGGETMDYWAGQANPDDWRGAALARIEKIRKGAMTVRVVDAKGKPVSGARVAVTMTRHAFRWGNIISSGNRLLDTKDADNRKMQETLVANYNTLTFEGEMKWRESTRWAKVDDTKAAIAWLHERGFAVRGHCLLWGSSKYLPDAVQSLSPDDLRDASRKHVTDFATQFKGSLYAWDVVNEAVTNTELWDKIGWETFAESYRWAKAADPQAELAYNDYNIINESEHGSAHRQIVKQRIQKLLDAKAPLQRIGIQGHFGLPLTPVNRVLSVLDEMAAFGLPLEITELDAGIPDDTVHGAYLRDLYIALFSHPSVDGVIQWGFWQGRHWRAAEGGSLFRTDWSKRPAQIAYEKLVRGDWWTRKRGVSNAKGTLPVRGFLGDYQVTVTDKKGVTKTVPFTLRKGGGVCRVAL